MPGYAGGTAAADLARLRRMINESGTATYTDATLVTIIAAYPVPDAAGEYPLLYSGSANTTWVATFDLAAAASDCWAEKEAALATGAYDFTADGATFHRSQIAAGARKQVNLWRSRRMALGHVLRADLGATTEVQRWIGNLAEPD